MSTLFTKIIDGQIPGQLVWRDELCVAFLDIQPLNPGHTLVVPRAEIDHWLDLPGPTRDRVMDVAARIGRAQMQAFTPQRVGVIIQGFEVPHAHVHVFPAHGPGDFDLSRSAAREPEQLAADADALRAALREQGQGHVVP